MNTTSAILLLLFAALLETGGDALIRLGLRGGTPLVRALWMLAGGVVLFAYAYAVNAPGWDFGRLLGIYVVFFFVIAQLVSWLVFHQRPGLPIVVGGGFIVLGGIVLSTWKA
jgi:drug/metabolite transporter (DMT)-like permease